MKVPKEKQIALKLKLYNLKTINKYTFVKEPKKLLCVLRYMNPDVTRIDASKRYNVTRDVQCISCMFSLQKIYLLGVDLFSFTSIDLYFKLPAIRMKHRLWMGRWKCACLSDICVFLYFCTAYLMLCPPPPPDIYIQKGGPSTYKTALVRQIQNCWKETCLRACSRHSTWNEAIGANFINQQPKNVRRRRITIQIQFMLDMVDQEELYLHNMQLFLIAEWNKLNKLIN